MSVRTFDTSALDAASMLPMPASDAADLRSARSAAFDEVEQSSTDDIPTSTGCLRGLCWAIGIESAAALCAYGIWRLWSLLQ